MYIHLGEDVVIRSSDIVAILEWYDELNEYIERYRAEERLFDISDNMTKSIIVTTKALYLSPLSSLTIKRRTLDKRANHLLYSDTFDGFYDE